MTVRQNLGFGLSIRKQLSREDYRAAECAPLPRLSDSTNCWTGSRRSSQAGSGNASRLDARSCASRWRFYSTSRCRISTRSSASRRRAVAAAPAGSDDGLRHSRHSSEPSLTLGDRIAILRDGVLQQVASPMELYARPANRFVAGFIGSPAIGTFSMGCCAGRMAEPKEDGASCSVEAVSLSVCIAMHRPWVAWYSACVRTVPGGGRGRQRRSLRAEVAVVEPMGNEQIVYATLPGGKRLVGTRPRQSPTSNRARWL